MTQMNETYLYRGSAKEAKRRDELPLWRESHKANIACREAIEDAIRRNFDGINLDPECLTPVLEEYGYKRTEWVLAATLRELKWDGRFPLRIRIGRHGTIFRRMNGILPISPFEAIQLCWMAS